MIFSLLLCNKLYFLDHDLATIIIIFNSNHFEEIGDKQILKKKGLTKLGETNTLEIKFNFILIKWSLFPPFAPRDKGPNWLQ